MCVSIFVVKYKVFFFSFGIFKSPSWAIQLCWISLRSSKIYLVMDAIKDSAKTVKKKRQDMGGIGTKFARTNVCILYGLVI